jgi:hypothetical protein
VIKVDVLNPEELPDANEGMGGFPADGDGFEENDEPEVEEEADEGNEPVVKPAANGVDYAAQMKVIQDQLAATQAELNSVRSQIPPPQRVKEEPVAEPDWNEEFYKDVPAAVKKLKASILQDAEKALTSKYQQDIGQRTFWSRFYAAHPDLEDADDLVRSTLSANMSQLGGLSIPKAIEGLAGLTRSRISVYVDKAVKARGKKATVEGAGRHSPTVVNQPQQDRPYSLGATIKARRAKRAAAS